jgi:site-specific DNA-cytosine methylase
MIAQQLSGTLGTRGLRSHTELDGHGAYIPVAFRKFKRAQSATDDESWIPAEQANKGKADIRDGSVSPTLCKGNGTVVHAVAFTDAGQGQRIRSIDESSETLRSTKRGPYTDYYNTGGTHGVNQQPEVSHAVAHAFYSTGGTHGVNQHSEVSPAVKVGSGLGIPSPPAVAHALRAVGFIPKAPANSRSIGAEIEKSPTVTTHQAGQGLFRGMTVRRLTPRECERLQGFPDDWTLIPWRKRDASDCPDGPRYKALGNSMAVNCMEWIGERIAAREAR